MKEMQTDITNTGNKLVIIILRNANTMLQLIDLMVGREGFEPSTIGLKGSLTFKAIQHLIYSSGNTTAVNSPYFSMPGFWILPAITPDRAITLRQTNAAHFRTQPHPYNGGFL